MSLGWLIGIRTISSFLIGFSLAAAISFATESVELTRLVGLAIFFVGGVFLAVTFRVSVLWLFLGRGPAEIYRSLQGPGIWRALIVAVAGLGLLAGATPTPGALWFMPGLAGFAALLLTMSRRRLKA